MKTLDIRRNRKELMGAKRKETVRRKLNDISASRKKKEGIGELKIEFEQEIALLLPVGQKKKKKKYLRIKKKVNRSTEEKKGVKVKSKQ